MKSNTIPLWKITAERLKKTWHGLHVTSAKPLSVEQKLELLRQYGIDRYVDVDPDLIGGVIIRKGSIQVDNSLKGQIKRLEKELS